MECTDLELVTRLKAFEGFRRYAYECSEGRLTIGYGTMIEAGGHGVPEYIAELLIRDYLQTLSTRFKVHAWFRKLDPVRQSAILEMGYQMGFDGVLGFEKMIEALDDGDWLRAHAEALESRWARQTPARAANVAERLRDGS